MAAAKQKLSAKENIKKAQEAWQKISPEGRAEARPEGREREKPGSHQGG